MSTLVNQLNKEALSTDSPDELSAGSPKWLACQ